MSLNSIQSNITMVQREIQQLQHRLSDKSRDEAAKTSRIAQTKRGITKNTSPSILQGKLRDIERLENDIIRIQQDKANISKQLADKTEKLHRYQQDYYKEQQREQNKLIKSLEKKQADNVRQLHAVLGDLKIKVQHPAHAYSVDASVDLSPMYDAFISYASEDKEDLVRHLVDGLINQGLTIWYDEIKLKVGDNLRRAIDAGLAKSKFGIVVLSPSFFAKNWPQYELDGLVQREMVEGKVILPLWHKVSKNEVMRYSPSLADKIALNTAIYTVEELVRELADVIQNA